MLNRLPVHKAFSQHQGVDGNTLIWFLNLSLCDFWFTHPQINETDLKLTVALLVPFFLFEQDLANPKDSPIPTVYFDKRIFSFSQEKAQLHLNVTEKGPILSKIGCLTPLQTAAQILKHYLKQFYKALIYIEPHSDLICPGLNPE